jgi:hypothetical protein
MHLGKSAYPIVVTIILISATFTVTHFTHASLQNRFEAYDVTEQVELLGQPFQKPTYARNVWDMQVYQGRIYLGHGNSSNFQPSPNAGPIPVIYYEPDTGQFVEEYTVDEEQIDIFRVIDGQLFIPGHDPRGSSNGNFYYLNESSWTKVSTIPGVYHTYDIASFDGKLFTANGTTQPNSIQVSSDEGDTWQVALAATGRVRQFFEFQGKLYAMKWIRNTNQSTKNGIDVYNGTQFVNANTAGSAMLPDYDEYLGLMVRINQFQEQLVYIGSLYGVNDHQWAPTGLYVAPELNQARRVTLPEPEALPYDILIRDDTIYVLAAVQQPSGGYTILVYTSNDLDTWQELFRFSASTFARSFEEYQGSFYFGLGSHTEPLAAETGTILRFTPASSDPTPTVTTTPSPTVTASLTPTTTPSPTVTASLTPTTTPSPTATATPTATDTAVPPATTVAVPSHTPSATATATLLPSLTPTPPSSAPTAHPDGENETSQYQVALPLIVFAACHNDHLNRCTTP